MPIRILVISNMYPSPTNPAFGVFVSDRVGAFRQLGAEVVVAANTDPSKGPVRTPAKYLRLLFRSVVAAFRHRPDIIEGHYLTPTAIITAITASIARRPFALYVHGSDVTLPAPTPVDRLLRWAVARAVTIQTNSEWTAELVVERFGRRPTVMPPGVDLRVFAPPPPEADRTGIGFAGGLVPHKGADVLLRSVALLKDRSVTVTLAGDGPERKTLEQLAQDLGISDRVTWLGQVNRRTVASVFSRAKVVAVPSRRDAFGLVAVEALACGTPVVVSDVGGLASIPAASCGSVVPPDDPAALAVALEEWLTCADETASQSAVERAAEFSLDRVTAEALADLSQA